MRRTNVRRLRLAAALAFILVLGLEAGCAEGAR
jgi:hypothetical protein